MPYLNKLTRIHAHTSVRVHIHREAGSPPELVGGGCRRKWGSGGAAVGYSAHRLERGEEGETWVRRAS